MSGYYGSFLSGRIAQAYKVLLERSPQTKNVKALRLPKLSPNQQKNMRLTPKKRHRAESLRLLFSGADGPKAAAVLKTVTESFVTRKMECDGEPVEYGIDAFGPYRLSMKKGLFSRTKKPTKKRVNFEELFLFFEGEPDELMLRVYDLLAKAIVTIESGVPAPGV